MNDISVLGYCWKNHLQAGYMKWHTPILELVGLDTTVTHLALRVNDWVVHPFSNNEIRWMKDRVSDRCFKQPCQEIYIGNTHKKLHEIQQEGNLHTTNTASCYYWFYTAGLYRNKRDCVSWVKNMLVFTNNIPQLRCQTPSCLLKDLENHGYGISR